MLDFKDLSFNFIDQKTLECDAAMAISEILANSPSGKCNNIQLLDLLGTAKATAVDLRQLVNGHDAASVLGVALRQMLAARARPQTWRSEIEANLRLAFDYEAFRSTAIYQGLRAWQRNNPGYRVLKAP